MSVSPHRGPTPSVAVARARVAGNAHHRNPDGSVGRKVDDPVMIEARQALAAASIAAAIERIVAKAPPLSADQVETLRALLSPGGDS
jgi:hypothetical protein